MARKDSQGRGGVKTYRTLEGGGELAPKVAPRRLGLLTLKSAIFFRISVEGGQFRGPWKFKIFTPPSNFRRFDPPYPGLQVFLGKYLDSRILKVQILWSRNFIVVAQAPIRTEFTLRRFSTSYSASGGCTEGGAQFY